MLLKKILKEPSLLLCARSIWNHDRLSRVILLQRILSRITEHIYSLPIHHREVVYVLQIFIH